MNDHLTSRLHDAPLQAATSRHEAMMAEARRIIDAGNDRGVVLRLTGGLAVRHYAIDLEFAELVGFQTGGPRVHMPSRTTSPGATKTS